MPGKYGGNNMTMTYILNNGDLYFLRKGGRITLGENGFFLTHATFFDYGKMAVI